MCNLVLVTLGIMRVFCVCCACREVSVLRLICKDTIEEDILQCAEKKLQLEKDINQIQSQPSLLKSALLEEGRGGIVCTNSSHFIFPLYHSSDNYCIIAN